jgi:hypothetical protein
VGRLRIGILDLVTKGPTKALYGRLMHPNLASIMPQAVAVWCEEAGHDVTFVCFTGSEDLLEELPREMDLLFIGAFSQAAQLSYAISNLFRQRGAVTVLGGPHARCYPDDATKYFDYVVGFTDKAVIEEILTDCTAHRPLGVHLSAKRQPQYLPGVRERWKFIEPTVAKSPTNLKGVPMIGSLGCPYTCSFCIDSVVDYQPLDYDQIREDLRFLIKKMPNAWVGWHDPNFGVRFDDYMSAIEDAIRPGTIGFGAESSLSLLKEDNLKRMSAAGFKLMLPGIESWYSLGGKSKTGRKTGMEKVKQVSEHVNMILEYIPYVQTNFVLGLDVDEGPEPFELTKRFIDLTPGAFPGYSLLSAFGEAAPLNLEFQRSGRIRPFPFHFLNNNQAMNVKPKNYEWREFYDHVIDLTKYSFSWKNIGRRARATRAGFATWVNILRAISSEGFGRIKYFKTLRGLLDTDPSMQRFFAGETTEIPSFFVDRVQRDLGELWEHLPAGALYHDPYAYLKKVNGRSDEAQATPEVAASAAPDSTSA